MPLTRFFLSPSSILCSRRLTSGIQATPRKHLYRGTILILFLSIFLLPQKSQGASVRQRRRPTVVLCPNIGEVGNYAACAPSPTLVFGNQGTGTASMAIPISVNNCSTSKVAACNQDIGRGRDEGEEERRDSGPVTLAGSPFTISGANAGDFTVSNGTCSPDQVLAAGEYCEPTVTFTPSASSGTSETATLTVREDGRDSTQTMSLTGTSATVTTLSSSSCPTSLMAGNYQLTADISCADTAFTYSGPGLIDVNLNGHTVTYGTASQATQIGAFLSGANFPELNLHNGMLNHGAGTNSFYSSNYETHRSSVAGFVAGTDGQGPSNQYFNLTIDYDYQYANAIEIGRGDFIAHDVTIHSTGVGTCNNPNCRSLNESAVIFQENGGTVPGGTQVYNIAQFGGPQGGITVDNSGAVVAYNYLNPGNMTGTNTNNFAIIAYGPNEQIHNNLIETPITPDSGTRGIFIDDAEGSGLGGRNVYDNYIGAYTSPNNAEYNKPPQSTYTSTPGCQIGGTYTTQFDDNPVGTNVAHDNINVVSVDICGSYALRVTDSQVTTNISKDNKYTAVRLPGAPTCVPRQWSEANTGCAFASGFAGPTGFTSYGDTFTGDSGDVLDGGASGVTFYSPTFNKGWNPSGFHTFVAQNGPGIPAIIHFVDATFNRGTSPTDAFFFPQDENDGPASFYIDWTQNILVTNSQGEAMAGVTATFTDALANIYTCTTNSRGWCSAVVTEYRDNNDGTPVPPVENRNPYSLSISGNGCATYTQTRLTISARGNLLFYATNERGHGRRPIGNAPCRFEPVRW